VITSTTCRRIATTLAWMVLLIGPDALASPEDRAGAIARDLTRLSLDLHDQLEATEANLSSGRLDDRQVADRLKEATEAVEGFAQQIDALPNDIGAALHNKLDAIGWQVENLRQTAETGIATSRLRMP
jgi:phosphoglycerate-specific signal transduction histidine kinase